NAHPHTDESGNVAVIHNGIIENYMELRAELKTRDHVLQSETDTEIFAHLVEEEFAARGNVGAPALLDAVRAALGRVRGAYAFVIMDARVPDLIIGARHFSPLVVGVGEKENLFASDIPALLAHTRRVLIIEDGEIVALTHDAVRIFTLDGQAVEREPFEVTWDIASAEKGGYPHFFIKEINEQPSALANALRGRLDTEQIHLPELAALDLERVERAHIVACGTSYHAGLAGKLAFEQWARMPVNVEIASEYRYASPVIDAQTLLILITQSGETADTLASFRLGKQCGAQALALTNAVGSSITRGANAALYLNVGPEIGVVASKTFTAQVALLELVALSLAMRRGTVAPDTANEIRANFLRLPDLMQATLGVNFQTQQLAQVLTQHRSAFFFGRGFGYVAALEGALKLKEVSYLHAEAYAAGELKHGPIAMLDPEIPVIAIATASATLDKVVSNMQEVRARRAPVIAIATDGDTAIESHADHVIYIPRAPEYLTPLLTMPPLQLLAYHVAIARGCDVDQPRNLAKSVTVE
ncbi:glutamine--fructose-6-phosphate transaminase (isomerizing), partial [Anaerolineae bacterium CFX7]|nr:glutamine--fructose-6-phosphate transaminase (isomerizing) [Anaerolineae bacterium CFX7]